MKHLFALTLFACSAVYAQQADVPASAPVGKPCSEMTKDATRIERKRCIPDDKCTNMTPDATRIERKRCEKLKK
jgi:hypothetical protein